MSKAGLARLSQELKALREQGRQIVVLQKDRVIPRFSEDGTTDILEFERQIRLACLERPGITEEEKLDLVWSNLSPCVQNEVLCHPPQTRKTADGVLGIVRAQFSDKRTLSQLTYAFHSVVQRPSEGVRDFSHRLNRAHLDLVRKQEQEEVPQTEEKILRDVFVGHLNDSLLRNLLRERVHQDPGKSFLQVRDEAIRWTEEDRPIETVSVHEVSSESPLLSMIESLTQRVALLLEEVKALKAERSQGSRRNGSGSGQHQGGTSDRLQGSQGQSRQKVCFQCGRPGHIVRNCRVSPAVEGFVTGSGKADVYVSPLQVVVPLDQARDELAGIGQKRRRRRRRRKKQKQEAPSAPTSVSAGQVPAVESPTSSRRVTSDIAGERIWVSVAGHGELKNPLGEFVPECDADQSGSGSCVPSDLVPCPWQRFWDRKVAQAQSRQGCQPLNPSSSGRHKVDVVREVESESRETIAIPPTPKCTLG